jgi:hypothetical protein
MFRFYTFCLTCWLLALLPRLAAATNPTLVVQGVGSGTADVTAFVDQVQILDASGNVVAGAVGDASFETVRTGTYAYQPAGSAWAFVGYGSGTGPGAGLTANGSDFAPPPAPDGTQAAFVQRTGYLRQTLALGAGTYRVRFQMAQRGGNSVAQQLDVQVLGVRVGTASLGSSSAYAQFTSGTFTVTSGVPTITGFNPSQAAAGTLVTLTGTNLSGTSRLTVNGVAARNVLVITNQQLTFQVPRGTGVTQLVTLTTPDGTASSTALTVTLGLVSSTPAANARRAPRLGSPVGLTFSEAVAANTLGNLAVFSAQVGGRKAGQWTGGGTPTVRFRSSLPGRRGNFQPGELVSVSVPSTVQTSGGRAVSREVFQFTAAVEGGTGSFGGGSDPVVGNYPSSVAVGDVDGDGDLDLLVANQFRDMVSVRLNDGAGTFSGTQEVPVGSRPTSVALGDVDGDGDLDLLTANNSSGTVSVRLNDGAGTFSGTQEVPVGSNSFSVAVGDVDSDGDLDLLTANYTSNTVSVRLNDGAGTFSGTQEVPVGSSPRSVAVGDVDSDGDLDLLAANYNSNTVSVRLNDGAGLFSGTQEVAVGSNPSSVAVGDVDSDGDLDLLAANLSSGNVSVLLNDGAGTFSGAQEVDVVGRPRSVAVGDVDGDGDLDLLTANNTIYTVSVRLNDGAGTFSGTQEVAVRSFPISVAVGDVDGDGDLDLLTANYNSNTVSVRLNGSGTTLAVTALAPLPNAVAAPRTSPVTASFNQPLAAGAAAGLRVFSTQSGGLRTRGATPATVSGNMLTYTPPGARPFLPGETVYSTLTTAVAASSGATLPRGRVQQFTAAVGGTGQGNFGGGSDPAVGSNPVSVAVGDVDGDGDLDLLTTNTGSGTVSVRLNNGAGSFSGGSNPAVGSAPQSVVLGDVDGDGDLDLLTANNNYVGTVSVRLNDGTGSFGGSSAPFVGNSPTSVVLGDVDGDGDLDLLTANSGSNTVSIRLNNGTGSFATPATNANPAVGSAPQSVVLGDVDGDGDLDLLTANYNDNSVSVRLNDGAGSFAAPATNAEPAVGNSPFSLALGDVDGDGDLDLLTANDSNGGTVSVRLNDGAGSFAAPATNAETTVGNYPRSLTLGDVDGDGDLDLLTANDNYAGTASVRLNDGAGGFAAPATNANPAVGSYSQSLALGDVDGDGDLDLLTANYNDNSVSVRLNQPYVPTVTSASPAAAGTGIPVTLTGTNLQYVTGVTVGGAAATITAQSATSLGFVVPAGAAAGSSPVVLASAAPAVSAAYTVLAAPGNALALDGQNDYVGLPAGAVTALQNDFTLELWLRTTQPGTSGGNGQWWEGTGLLDGEVSGPAADYGLSLRGTRVAFGVGGGTGAGSTSADVTIQSTTLVNDGRWHYVVATRRASDGLMTLYIDGQPQATATGSSSARTAPPQLTLGVVQSTAATGSNFFAGSLDEVRLWSTVRSAASIATAYQAGPPTNLSQTGLVAYYSFDEGLPGGANTDLSQLFDLTPNAYHGALSGLALASGTTSNFVASYALVVPTATAATNVTSTGFTATWMAPVVGTLDAYLLDVATVADFSAPVAGSPFTVAASARSQQLTNLTGSTSYYYRLRAERSSLTGQGAPSNVVVVSAPLPVTLLSFTAERLGAAVLLRWATASEVNSAYFQVERSTDGMTFAPLAQLAAAGTSANAHSYAFTDANAPAGTLYYRLRQVDTDGSASYSPVRAITRAATGLALYPNPAHGSTTLTGATAATSVHVLDALGRVVLTTTTDATGAASLALPAGLVSGVYVVRAGPQTLRLLVE